MDRDTRTANELTTEARSVIKGARAGVRRGAIGYDVSVELRRRGMFIPAPATELDTRGATLLVVTRRGARIGRIIAEQERAEAEHDVAVASDTARD